jgi:hypothetical protein
MVILENRNIFSKKSKLLPHVAADTNLLLGWLAGFQFIEVLGDDISAR